MSNTTASRERRPSTSAPISDLQGPIGPAGISRPKHKRTFTGFGAGEIKNVEGKLPLSKKPHSRGWWYVDFRAYADIM